MKNIKIVLGLILLTSLQISCEVEGISNDVPNIASPTASVLSKVFDVSTDNSGVVRITPTGTGISRSIVEFGHGSGVASSASVVGGQSVTHVYPEGNYTVTIKSYDLAGRETVQTYPLVVTYVAPTDVKVLTNVAGYSATVTPTANYAKGGYTIDFGDGTPLVTILENASSTHVYSKAGTYTVTVKALSGGAATTTVTTAVTITKPFSLPVTFEDAEINYGIGGIFGGVQADIVTNPYKTGLNTSEKVWRFTKSVGAETWGGTWTPMASPGGVPINIDNGSKFTMLVYATETGKNLHFQLESPSTSIGNQSVDVAITAANQWQLLTFDFSGLNIPAGTTFGQYVVQYNLSGQGTGEVIYIDSISQTK